MFMFFLPRSSTGTARDGRASDLIEILTDKGLRFALQSLYIVPLALTLS